MTLETLMNVKSYFAGSVESATRSSRPPPEHARYPARHAVSQLRASLPPAPAPADLHCRHVAVIAPPGAGKTTAHRHSPRFWIDASGYSPADFSTPPEICGLFDSLSAAKRPADLFGVVDRFAAFAPTHGLFTHRDEAPAFGPIINETCRTGRGEPIASQAA